MDGITDLVEDGVDGLLAAPGDPEGLARVLGSVIRGEVDNLYLRTAAWHKQTRQYSDRSMAAGVARVYREILGQVGLHTSLLGVVTAAAKV